MSALVPAPIDPEHSSAGHSLTDRELLDKVLERSQLRITQEQASGLEGVFTRQHQIVCTCQILRNIGVEVTRLGCDVSGDKRWLHPESTYDLNTLAAFSLRGQFVGPRGETHWRQIVENFEYAPGSDVSLVFKEYTRTPRDDEDYLSTIFPGINLKDWVAAETAYLQHLLISMQTQPAISRAPGVRL